MAYWCCLDQRQMDKLQKLLGHGKPLEDEDLRKLLEQVEYRLAHEPEMPDIYNRYTGVVKDGTTREK